MTVRKGIYRVLACPCGYSALQQEENPKVFHCEHCGRVRTVDGSPPPLNIQPIVGKDGTYFADDADREHWESFGCWQDWFDAETAKCALPPEMIDPKYARENS